MARVWLWLLAGPALFLLVIVAVSGWLGATGTPGAMIGLKASALAPQMLLAVLLALALLCVLFLPLRQIWAAEPGRLGGDIGIGAAAGAAIAGAYFVALAPLMALLQARVGDYVPPGAVLDTVSAGLGAFLVANVLLAPAVEETIYRGHALRVLRGRFGARPAVLISCAFFGLLHWSGGVWYMLLTGGVAGGAFCGLALWRGGILAPFVAHLTLNLIEFAVVALR